MRIISIIGGLFFIILTLLSCEKDNDNISILDKEIRVPFTFAILQSTGTTFELPPTNTFLLDFDKRNYLEVDSIFFVCSMTTNSKDVIGTARLFNITDSTEIAGTELIVSAEPYKYEWKITPNLIDKLPEANIDLAIQLKVNNNFAAFIGGAYLKLKRK